MISNQTSHAIMAIAGRAVTAMPQVAECQAGREVVMAKGQMRSSKEKKKPKAEWNKKKKGGAAPPPSGQPQPVSSL